MEDPLHYALVSVRATAAEGGATALYARAHRWEVGESLAFDVKDARIAATEYLVGALAAELVHSFQQLAERYRLEVFEVEAVTEAAVEHPLVHLGVIGEEGEPRLARLTMKVYVSTAAAMPEVDRVWQEALRRAPLANTLKRCLEFRAELQITT